MSNLLKMRGIMIAALVSMMLLGTTAVASPLVPFDTQIDLQTHGQANINTTEMDRQTQFSGSQQVGSFDAAGVGLTNNSSIGHIPGWSSKANIGASAQVEFQQVSFNEYMLELSASALGNMVRGALPPFEDGQFDAMGDANVNSRFLIAGFPEQEEGAPATVKIEWAFTGMMHSVNNATAHTDFDFMIGVAGNQYDDGNSLMTPQLPMGGFSDQEFTGHINMGGEGILAAYVGDVIDLSAMLTTDVHGHLNGEPWGRIAADSDLTPGLRIHLTVMPEPAALSLLGIGSLLILRRRRA